MCEPVGEVPLLGLTPHAAGLDQGGTFDQGSQAEVTVRPFPCLQRVIFIFPRVCEYAVCLFLDPFVFLSGTTTSTGKPVARHNDQHRETCGSHLIHHSGCLLCLQLLHALLWSVRCSRVVTFCAHTWWRMLGSSRSPQKKHRTLSWELSTSLKRSYVRRTDSSPLGSCWRNHSRITGVIATSVSRTSSGSCSPPNLSTKKWTFSEVRSRQIHASGWWSRKVWCQTGSGRRTGPSWRTWSNLARDFVGVVHTALKQVMKNAENQKQPVSATHLQHDLGVTRTRWIKSCNTSWSQGLRERLWRLFVELNGNQTWNNGEDWLLCMTHWQLEEVWTTATKSCLHRKPQKWRTSPTLSKLGKTSNKDTKNSLETSYPKTCDLLFFSPCVPLTSRKS